jgi:hypothetical protein
MMNKFFSSKSSKTATVLLDKEQIDNYLLHYKLDHNSIELIKGLEKTNDRTSGGLTGLYNIKTGTLIVGKYAAIPKTDSNKPTKGQGSAHEVMASEHFWKWDIGAEYPIRVLSDESKVIDFEELRGWSIIKLEHQEENPKGKNLIVRFGSMSMNQGRPGSKGRFMSREDRIGIMVALRYQGEFKNIMYTYEPGILESMEVDKAEREIIESLRD